jgi:uncharacterized protein
MPKQVHTPSFLSYWDELKTQLACPKCHGKLDLARGASEIVCTDCLRVYPVLDGIPVLISERASIAGETVQR